MKKLLYLIFGMPLLTGLILFVPEPELSRAGADLILQKMIHVALVSMVLGLVLMGLRGLFSSLLSRLRLREAFVIFFPFVFLADQVMFTLASGWHWVRPDNGTVFFALILYSAIWTLLLFESAVKKATPTTTDSRIKI